MTLLVIVPGRNFEHHRTGCVFNILNAETGEHLASHFCSNYSFAYGDLYFGRKDRIEEWTKRFGELDVKFIDETDISEDELLRRNKEWYESVTKSSTETTNDFKL